MEILRKLSKIGCHMHVNVNVNVNIKKVLTCICCGSAGAVRFVLVG